MPVKYDEYYSTQDHAVGPAFKEVIAFFQNLELGQTVLDVGVGQGRDAIPLAQMGHRVIGIELSSIGIEQLKNAAVSQHLNIDAKVADLCTYSQTERLDIILFDRGRNARPHWFGLGWVGGPCRIDNGVYLSLDGRWIGKAFGKDGN